MNLHDGFWADEYTSPDHISYIKQQYSARYQPPGETPITHPWKFDPVCPPSGWRYDPYYEMWIAQ